MPSQKSRVWIIRENAPHQIDAEFDKEHGIVRSTRGTIYFLEGKNKDVWLNQIDCLVACVHRLRHLIQYHEENAAKARKLLEEITRNNKPNFK